MVISQNQKKRLRKAHKMPQLCSSCGRDISETEAIVYDSKCKRCYDKGESYELEEGLMALEELS